MCAVISAEVRRGPVLRTALDVLECAVEISECLPEECPRTAELMARVDALMEICERELKVTVKDVR